MKNEIILFENQDVKLEVNMRDETVWLTQEQMANLFGKAKSTINEHIKNIYREEELFEIETMTKFGNSEFSDKPLNYYNLDVIISVGYRVKSKNGIAFRRWANKILKEYIIKGYAVNQRRLEYLEKTIQLIDSNFENVDAKEILKVIGNYSKALNLLDDYDHKTVSKIRGNISKDKIEYQECMHVINTLRFHEESDLFALERNHGLKAIIGNLYQTFDGKDVYVSIEEKAANFLYMVVKNHVFIDGNKRIAATLFIYFLQFYNILYRKNKQIIDNNTLTALTLLIAESNPKEKEILVDLVMNFFVD